MKVYLLKKYYCIDCKKEICYNNWRYGNKRCASCAMKRRFKNPKNHPMFGKHHTKTTKKKMSLGHGGTGIVYGDEEHKCIDCGKEIARGNKLGRCKSCENKRRYKLGIMNNIGKNHPNYGKKNPEHSKRMMGKNNPNYIHGEGNFPYPLEFNDKLKLKIRKRDNYTCQNCNITEEEHLIVYGRVLEVHHIDYSKENCKEDNLITLCMACNIRANFNRDYWQEFYINKIGVL